MGAMTLLKLFRRLLRFLAGLIPIYAYARYAVRRFEQLEPEQAGAPGSFIEVDGVRLHYVSAGQGSPVLLIHGLGASTFSYRYTIPELSRHFRVIAPDLLGFGYSARPADADYSLTAQARRLRALLDALGIERAAVVGHSMGGALAMRFATSYAERVSRLVLIDSAVDRELRRGGRLVWLFQALLPVGALFTIHSRRFRRRALRVSVHDPAHVTDEVVEGYFRPARMKGHLRALGRTMASWWQDELVEPERIAQPTLLLWGEHDRLLPPRVGEELARRIPNAKLMVVPSAGHQVPEEQPALANRLLLDFLRAPEPARVEAQTTPAG